MKRLAPRHSGRPSPEAAEQLNHLIHSTAGRLFIEQGYAATSMEQVATAAGVSKQTLYRRYCSKEELFVAVMLERSRSLREASTAAMQEETDPLAALRYTCSQFMEFIAKPEPLATYRVLIAEALRFPTLVDNVRAATMEPIFNIIRTLLRDAQNAGQMRRDIGIEDALQSLFGLTLGWLLHQSLLGGQSTLRTIEARRAFFERAWDVFVLGIQPSRHESEERSGGNRGK